MSADKDHDCETMLVPTSGPGRRFRRSRGEGTFSIPNWLVIMTCRVCGDQLLNGAVLDVLAAAEEKQLGPRAHLIDGEFQSDKYPETPRGKVPLSVKDPTAQDLLWEYAQRRRVVDAEFAEDLETALWLAGYRKEKG